MSWAVHVARMEKHLYTKFWVRNLKGKRPFWRRNRRQGVKGKGVLMINHAPRHKDVSLSLIKHHAIKAYKLLDVQYHVFLKVDQNLTWTDLVKTNFLLNFGRENIFENIH
jgi:hypothetical protein